MAFSVEGRILNKSPQLVFKSGPRGFISMQQTMKCESRPFVFVVFTDEALSPYSHLEVGKVYVFDGLMKSVWSASGNNDTSSNNWYSATKETKIRCCSDHLATDSMKVISITSLSIHDHAYLKRLVQRNGMSYDECIDLVDAEMIKHFLTWSNDSFNSCFLSTSAIELNLRVKLHRVHESGWIDIFTSSSQYKLSLFLTHYRMNDDLSNYIYKGQTILCRSVQSIYLRGKLQGFALTVRSSVDISKNENQQKQHINRPPELSSRSYIFSAWWVEVYRKFASSISPGISVTRLCTNFLDAFKNSNGQLSPNFFDSCLLVTRNVSREFSDANYLNFFVVQGCQDVDWTSSILPEVLSISEVNKQAFAVHDSVASISGTSECRYRLFDLGMIPKRVYDEAVRVILFGEVVDYSFCIDHTNTLQSLLILFMEDAKGGKIYCLATGDSTQSIILYEKLRHAAGPKMATLILVRNPKLMVESIPSLSSDIVKGKYNFIDIIYCRIQDVDVISQISCKRSLTSSEICEYRTKESCFEINNLSHVDLKAAAISKHSWALPYSSPEIFHSIRQIRQILHFPFQHESYVGSFQGLVIWKEIVLQNENKRYKSSQKYSNQQVLIILRDVTFPDSIIIYLPMTIISKIFVGAVIAIHGGVLVKSQSGRNIFVKIRNDAVVDSIGLISLTSEKSLSYLFDLDERPTTSKLILERCQYHPMVKDPPSSFIINLEKYITYDRCCWTITGRVEAIKTVVVKLRCQRCLQDYSNMQNRNYSRIKCLKCESILELIPTWEGILLIDDSTSTAFMTCEGKVMIKFLNILCKRNPSQLQIFMNLMEEGARKYGYERLDTFFMTRCAFNRDTTMIVGNDDDDDVDEIFDFIEGESPSNHKRNSSLSIAKLDALSEALSSSESTDRLKFIVQLSHFKRNETAKMRNIKIQEYRPYMSYAVSNLSFPSYFPESIYMDCRDLIEYTKYTVQDEIYSLLQRLS